MVGDHEIYLVRLCVPSTFLSFHILYLLILFFLSLLLFSSDACLLKKRNFVVFSLYVTEMYVFDKQEMVRFYIFFHFISRIKRVIFQYIEQSETYVRKSIVKF